MKELSLGILFIVVLVLSTISTSCATSDKPEMRLNTEIPEPERTKWFVTMLPMIRDITKIFCYEKYALQFYQGDYTRIGEKNTINAASEWIESHCEKEKAI